MKRFALIMIDMQRGFLDPASPLCIPSAAATVPACAAAMDACRRAGTPVVYATRHYRADGSDVERCRRGVWFAGGRPLSEVCPPEMSAASSFSTKSRPPRSRTRPSSRTRASARHISSAAAC